MQNDVEADFVFEASASGNHVQLTHWVRQGSPPPESQIVAATYGEWLRAWASEINRLGGRVIVAMSLQEMRGQLVRCVCLLQPVDPVVDAVVGGRR